MKYSYNENKLQNIVEVKNVLEAFIAETSGADGVFFSLYSRDQDTLPLQKIHEIQNKVSIPCLVSIQQDHEIEAQIIASKNAFLDVDRTLPKNKPMIKTFAESAGFWQMLKLNREDVQCVRSVRWESAKQMKNFFDVIHDAHTIIQESSFRTLIKEAKQRNIALSLLQELKQSQTPFLLPFYSWMNPFDPATIAWAKTLGSYGTLIGNDVFYFQKETSENYSKTIPLSEKSSQKKLKALIASSQNFTDIDFITEQQILFEEANHTKA